MAKAYFLGYFLLFPKSAEIGMEKVSATAIETK
jgi:hypothetical protein